MNISRKIILPTFAVIFILWLEFNAKANAGNQLQQMMVADCSTDSHCVDNVNTHFSTCFDSIYEDRSDYQTVSLAAQELTTCIEQHSKAK
ncbi:MAG: hypothetical protein AAFY63_10650 [Cyanobacteria bacterium J06643_13]